MGRPVVLPPGVLSGVFPAGRPRYRSGVAPVRCDAQLLSAASSLVWSGLLAAALFGALESDEGLVDLLAGQRRFGQFVGALGAEGVEHQVEVAAPCLGAMVRVAWMIPAWDQITKAMSCAVTSPRRTPCSWALRMIWTQSSLVRSYISRPAT